MSKLPETGSSLLRYLRTQKRQALRQAQSSAFVRSGVAVTPGGLSIPNDALVSPVKGGQGGTYTVNFAVPIAGAVVASVTIAIPAGFTDAQVYATAHASAMNTGAGNDYLYVGASINSVAPSYLLAPITPSGYATSSGSASRNLSGLSGGVITVSAMVHSSFTNWAAIGSNHASIDAIAIFTR